MIRKEVKSDNSFGGNYPLDIEYTNLPKKLIEITEAQRDYIDANLDKLRYINNEIVDISNTPEYIAKEQEKQNQILKAQLVAEMNELDIKRIRAIAEPSLKDENTTWLDYYTEQIQLLRQQIAEL